jgi:nitrate reductase gamma subunit
MFPVFEPALTMFEPVILGIVVLAIATVAAVLVVVGLVALASRRVVRPATSATRLRPDLPEAA